MDHTIFTRLSNNLRDVSMNFYSPQTKLREGNVFTHICDSVHGGGLCPGKYLSGRPPPGTVKSGRYTSCWNAFLLKEIRPQLLAHQYLVNLCSMLEIDVHLHHEIYKFSRDKFLPTRFFLYLMCVVICRQVATTLVFF